MIGCSYVDEDIFGIEGNFGVFVVDDGGERVDFFVCVKDNWVDGFVVEDVEVMIEMFVGFVEVYEFFIVDFFGLV